MLRTNVQPRSKLIGQKYILQSGLSVLFCQDCRVLPGQGWWRETQETSILPS